MVSNEISNEPQDLDISIPKLLQHDIACSCDETQVNSCSAFSEQKDDEQRDPALIQDLLIFADHSRRAIQQYPYGLPLYVILAQHYSRVAYPDLAAGAAYKALLLSDAVQSEEDEYHELAVRQCLELIAQSTANSKLEVPDTILGETGGYDDAVDDASRLEAVLKQKYMPEM